MNIIDIFSRNSKNFFSMNSINRYILYLLYAGLGLAGLIFFYIIFICLSYFFNRADLALEIEQYRKWVHGTNEFPKKPPIKIYASEGTLLGEYLPERGSWITLSACSNLKWLKEATLAVEDSEFYSHNGVSYKGIVRAAWRNLKSFSVREGAGTITQQLARNLFTGRERSFYRKLYETLIAFQLEKQLNKKEIMCLYLNKIYMGEGRIGAEEASWFYFRKPPWKLDAPEAAMIVGLFPSPLYYSPLNNIHLSLKKQSMVLDRLVENNVLSLKERNKSMRRFVKRYGIKLGLEADAGQVGQYGASRDFRLNIAPSVNEYVKKFLYRSIPEDVIQEGGLDVHTTIEPKRQAIALRTVRQEILSLRKKMLVKNRVIDAKKMKEWSNRLNGSLVSIDASNGKILSVVGGYTIIEGSMTQRVWSMLRQPGSSIKGFLYAVSLDEGQLNLDSLVVDEAINIAGYKPRNWNRKFLGEVELSRAVAMSINTVAVKTLHNLGVGTFRDRLRDVLQLGFFEERDRFPTNLSLALGSAEQTPLELARLYASITNGGYAVKPKLIERVVDVKSQVIWQASSVSPLSESNLLSSQSCAEVLKLMESVFDPEKEGTAGFIGKRRNENPDYLPFPIAGKTGTVQIPKQHKKRYRGLNGARDAWFVGIVPNEVTVLWFGQDDGIPMPASGPSVAAVWARYAQAALLGKKNEKFPLADDEYKTEDLEEDLEENIEENLDEDLEEDLDEDLDEDLNYDEKKGEEKREEKLEEGLEKKNNHIDNVKDSERENEVQKDEKENSHDAESEYEKQEQELKESDKDFRYDSNPNPNLEKEAEYPESTEP